MASPSARCSDPFNLCTLLLAAGGARRFGAPKQLAQIDHKPLILHTLENYQAVSDDVHVVLGAHAQTIASALPEAVQVHDCPHWQDGMSASLKFGLRRLPPDCSHVLIGLSDQVAITENDLLALIRAARQQPQLITAAYYADIFAVPAIFPRSSWPLLAGLQGDRGARQVLNDTNNACQRVDMPNGQWDIDTPEQLQRWQHTKNNKITTGDMT